MHTHLHDIDTYASQSCHVIISLSWKIVFLTIIITCPEIPRNHWQQWPCWWIDELGLERQLSNTVREKDAYNRAATGQKRIKDGSKTCLCWYTTLRNVHEMRPIGKPCSNLHCLPNTCTSTAQLSHTIQLLIIIVQYIIYHKQLLLETCKQGRISTHTLPIISTIPKLYDKQVMW